MVTKENIQDYALKLMFRMKDDEFEAFEKEFETILKQMDLIGQIEGIENVEEQDKICKLLPDTMQGYLFGRPAPADEFEKVHMAAHM